MQRLQYQSFSSSTSPVFIAETTFEGVSNNQFHTHDFYEIFLVLSGSLAHHHLDEDFLLSPNSVQFILPCDVHMLSSSHCNQKTSILNIAFPKTLLTAENRRLLELLEETFPSQSIPDLIPSSHIWKTLLELVHQIKDNSNYELKQLYFSSFFNQTILSYLHHYKYQTSNAPTWLLQSMNQMRIHNHLIKGLPKFVELSGKTQEHLSRQLKRHFNTTPTAYINALKLEYSALLLTSTNKAILDIIYESGFNSISHYSKLFKAHFSLTPTAYRNKNSLIFDLTKATSS